VIDGPGITEPEKSEKEETPPSGEKTKRKKQRTCLPELLCLPPPVQFRFLSFVCSRQLRRGVLQLPPFPA